jgi:hypothetical protein
MSKRSHCSSSSCAQLILYGRWRAVRLRNSKIEKEGLLIMSLTEANEQTRWLLSQCYCTQWLLSQVLVVTTVSGKSLRHTVLACKLQL